MATTSSGFSMATMTRAASISFSHVLPRLSRYTPVRIAAPAQKQHIRQRHALCISTTIRTVRLALPDIALHVGVEVLGADVHVGGQHQPQVLLLQCQWV